VEANPVWFPLVLRAHTICGARQRLSTRAVKRRRTGVVLTLLAVLPWLVVLACDLPIHCTVAFATGLAADQMHRFLV
jgi:hypothetical protein